MKWETSYLIPHGSADGSWGVCEEGGGDMVADVHDHEHAEARANLIAAAPEVLEAADNFLAAFGGDIPDWLEEEADALRAAIQKARRGT